MGREYWIKSRYAGKCSECECDFWEGDEILYIPHEGSRSEVFCRPCGDDVISDNDEIEVDV